MEKKLFVFDFDGTLLNSSGEILDSTINTLTKANENGHIITICTGKSFDNIAPYLNQLKFIKMIASCNGSSLYDLEKQKNISIANPLGLDAIEFIVELAKKYKRELIWHTVENKTFRIFFGTNDEYHLIPDKSFQDIESKHKPFDKWDEVKHTLYEGKVNQITLKIELSKINEPYEIIKEKLGNNYSVIIASRIYIDINAKEVNKAYAVKKMQEYYSISNESTYTFGDSDNDISMTKYSGNGICLANATKNLKYYATWSIGDNDSNAISSCVTKIIDNKENFKQLEPSLLAFDINNMDNQLQEVKNCGIECIHYDVMDEFVNNHSFGNEWMDTINKMNLKTTVHLMVLDPYSWILKFVDKSPWAITFQFEALNFIESNKCIKLIKSHAIKAGIAIKPYTKIQDYYPLLSHVDIVTIMSVEPGMGGQKFNDDAINNLINVYNFKKRYNPKLIIQVDGGIKIDNLNLVLNYADYFVSGTGFMKLNKEDKVRFISNIKENR